MFRRPVPIPQRPSVPPLRMHGLVRESKVDSSSVGEDTALRDEPGGIAFPAKIQGPVVLDKTIYGESAANLNTKWSPRGANKISDRLTSPREGSGGFPSRAHTDPVHPGAPSSATSGSPSGGSPRGRTHSPRGRGEEEVYLRELLAEHAALRGLLERGLQRLDAAQAQFVGALRQRHGGLPQEFRRLDINQDSLRLPGDRIGGPAGPSEPIGDRHCPPSPRDLMPGTPRSERERDHITPPQQVARDAAQGPFAPNGQGTTKTKEDSDFDADGDDLTRQSRASTYTAKPTGTLILGADAAERADWRNTKTQAVAQPDGDNFPIFQLGHQTTSAKFNPEATVWSAMNEIAIKRTPDGSKLQQGALGAAHCCQFVFSAQEPPTNCPKIDKVLNSTWFTVFFSCVLLSDAIFSFYTTNYYVKHLTDEPTALIYVVETLLLVFYCMELAAKLLVHKAFFFWNENWKMNIFETAIVIYSIYDHLSRGTGSITFLRTMRILKIARIFRGLQMMRFLKDMRLMVECLLGCAGALFWCLLLILMILYMFAIFFVQAVTAHLMGDHGMSDNDVDRIRRSFGSIELTVLTLFQAITGGEDWIMFYRMIESCGSVASAIFLFFIAFFSIAAWNIVTSLFIEKAMQVVQPKTRDLMISKRLQDKADAAEITEMCKKLDMDDEGLLLSMAELQKFIEDDDIMESLIVRDLDIRYPQTLFNMLKGLNPEQNSDSIRISDFVSVCLKMRGNATRLDLGTFRYETLNSLYGSRSTLDRCMRKLTKLQDAVARLSENFEKRMTPRTPRAGGEYAL